VARDWHAWHREYDDPTSSLSRRLVAVREQLTGLLAGLTGPAPRLVSMCAGDGRDALPVLAAGGRQVRATLVELDPELSAAARDEAARLGLEHVEVRTADAGSTDSYAGATPADVLLACGVFGNVTDDDLVRTVHALPGLLAAGAPVIWTRGSAVPDDPSDPTGDPSEWVRSVFADAGFEELAFIRPADADFRVGVHRLVAPPAAYSPGQRLFTFV
jgi:hypothetical protein